MTTGALSTKARIRSIDLLRGLVMIIMALDHARDYFHIQAMTGDPTDLATTTPALFFTRWITHFCAPVFVFLSGVSAYLSGLRITKAQLSGFLIKRGLWLVLVEIIIITFGWTFNPFYNVIILQVIWAIGLSMLVLGLLVRLPFSIVLATGLLIIAFHNLLDYPEAATGVQPGLWWDLLHHARFTPYTLAAHHVAVIAYAFMPWTGIMIVGYCFGKLYSENISNEKRSRLFLSIGLGMVLLFILLRSINHYGDPFPWKHQRSSIYSLLSFLNVTKYPPSLMYTCMTLGPAIIMLTVLEKARNKLVEIINVYGRVPFFYYVLHLYLIHLVCLILFFATGRTSKEIANPPIPFLFRPPDFGFTLWGVYALWLMVIILLYPLCNWYNHYKFNHHQWWLKYI